MIIGGALLSRLNYLHGNKKKRGSLFIFFKCEKPWGHYRAYFSSIKTSLDEK